MSFFSSIFDFVLIRPLFNILVAVYNFSGDFGIAIIILTILVKIVLYPFSVKSLKSQRDMAQLQPHIAEIQKKHNHDKAEQSKALMDLYKNKGINPLGGCLPILIQLPVFFALFSVLRTGLESQSLSNLYSFIQKPEIISSVAFGFLDLKAKNIWLALAVGAAQFVQARFSQVAKLSPANQQILYILPIVLFIVAMSLPAGVALYLGVSTLLGMVEQRIINRPKKSPTSSLAPDYK